MPPNIYDDAIASPTLSKNLFSEIKLLTPLTATPTAIPTLT